MPGLALDTHIVTGKAIAGDFMIGSFHHDPEPFTRTRLNITIYRVAANDHAGRYVRVRCDHAATEYRDTGDIPNIGDRRIADHCVVLDHNTSGTGIRSIPIRILDLDPEPSVIG